MNKDKLTVITDARNHFDYNMYLVGKASHAGIRRIIIRGYQEFTHIEKLYNEALKYRTFQGGDIVINSYPNEKIMSLKPEWIHLNKWNAEKIISCKDTFSKSLNFGVSVHNMEEMEMYFQFEPKYILLSPVFTPSCKKGVSCLGLEGTEGLSERIYEFYRKKAITPPEITALGGITHSNYNCVLDLKRISGVGVMSKGEEFIDHL